MNLQHEIERLLALHRNAARKEALPVIDEFRAGPSIPTRLSGHVRKPGSRPASGGFAMKHHISVYASVIVKYRDEKTDPSTMLEQALRWHMESPYLRS
jgi:hypothetical protein